MFLKKLLFNNFMTEKKYRVHLFENKGRNIQNKLEQFLNNLKGEVVSIIPDIKKSSLPQIYGATAKVDFLMIVERV